MSNYRNIKELIVDKKEIPNRLVRCSLPIARYSSIARKYKSLRYDCFIKDILKQEPITPYYSERELQ